jgi:isopenicillin-N epimerase
MYTRRKFLQNFLATAGTGYFVLNSTALAQIEKVVNKLETSVSAKELADDEDFWRTIQNAFDVDRKMLNLNNGGVSPAPRVVIDSFKQNIDYSNLAPSFYMWKNLEPKIEEVREKLALTLGCNKEEVAITRNASESLENLLLGFNLKAGDEILTTTQDYPRNLTTCDQLERRSGVKTIKVKYPIPLKNKSDYVHALEKGITDKTKLILVSHICFLTGQILPIKEVSKIAHKSGIDVIADCAHSLNHVPYKISDLDCDYLGASLHKWTYAPIGTGILYIKKEKIKNIWPLMAAPKSLEDNIRKFEEIGTHPAANHNAILDALQFNQTIGIERKAERFRHLHKRWINRIKQYSSVHFNIDIDDESNWAGIVNVSFDGVNYSKLENYFLEKHNIFFITIIFDEFNGIRITPNVYTTIEEIDRFADVIEKVAKGEIKEVLN